MGVSNKGKEVATGSGKGKRPISHPDKNGRNKRNRGVVQFFDEAAYEVDDDDDDDVSDLDSDDWDFYEDENEAQPSNVNNGTGKAHNVSVFPKEEELSEGELERMVEERYRPGSSFVTYADDRPNKGRTVDGNEGLPSYKEPIIWKVKCMIGREKQSVFCLMQKYVELNSLGNKLHVISAISIEHIKGFIYIEAERQSDINEACKGVSTIYSSRLAPVPKNEVSTSLSVRSKCNEVSIGSWARVKNGKYRGDLAQVIAVNDSRKKATVKLIPRIDLQVLAEKYGGGVASKKNKAVPAPRLVTSTELEEFRPLIQYRRDRESGLAFDVLDGMMLKDGYLYKKVLMDSLNLYGVVPSEEELLKFESSKNEAPDCQEWLTELYGEKKKQPRVVKSDKGGGGKGEGSSTSNLETSFEVNDLVLFNKKEFGVIVGLEKEEYYRVLKEGTEKPVVLTVDMRQLKKASFENRFTALDKYKKMISINDNVRVLEGPLEGRQGNVKHIYRGIIFLHDEIEQENNGYFCCKSQICEKFKNFNDASKGKDGESSFPAFDDPPLSPKSPLASEKPWETRGRNSSFNREGEEGSFTIGQSLRIRVGPLKGYLCRVLAVRRTGVTVKLDSQHKILTVKSEHLAEVRGRSSAIPMSDDKDAKPFDLLGNPDGSADWMAGAGTSADGERSSWPAFPSSGTSAQPESNSAMETDEKDEGGGWGSKATPKASSAWGNTASDEKPVVENEQAGGWGNKPKTSTEDQDGSSQGAGGWGSGGGNWGNKSKTSTEEQGGSSQDTGTDWGSKPITAPSNDATSTWGKKDKAEQGGGSQDAGGNWGSKPNTTPSNDATSTWGKKDNTSNMGPPNSWGKESNAASGGSNWGKSVDPVDKVSGESVGGWGDNVAKPMTQAAPWGKPPSSDAGQSENWGKIENKKEDTSPGWGKPPNVGDGQGGSWGKMKTQDDGSAPAWGKTVESSDGGQGGSWGKNGKKDDGAAPAWGKNVESSDVGQGGSWGKSTNKRDETEPAWGKKAESPNGDQGGSWGKSNTRKDDDAPAWGKAVESSNGGQGGSWGKSSTKKVDDAPASGKAVEPSDSWGKSNTKKDDDAPAWGKAVESSSGGNWGKKVESSEGGNWGGKSGTKKEDSAPAAWGNKGSDGSENESWGKPPPPKPWAANKDDSSEKKAVAWNSSASGQSGGGWGSGGGGSSWGKQNDGNNEGGYGGDLGGRRGGWRGGGRDDQGGERGGGGGGRWGGERSGFRGRGRSDYGSGGRFGGGRGRRDENNNNSDWGNNQNDRGGGRSQSWGSTGGNSSGGGGGWGTPRELNEGQSSILGKPKEANEGQPSILGKPKEANVGDGGSQSSGWGAPKGSNGGGGESSGQWGKPAGGSKGGGW